MADTMEREIDWEDVIEKDSSEFVLLPEGDYNFTVEKFERGRHAGSAKLPACNKAIITLKVESAEGTATITNNLFLHSKTEGLLSAFFACIGQKKKGEALKMNWSTVPGSTGVAKVGIHAYTNDDGEEKKYNEIKRFHPKEEGPTFKEGEF